ncbi:RNA polymerase sigma factor [Actinoplanes sp. N902-109]|uniref:RNA polymerase sigma factor n=1 Tax=Actinoplanes sp. (strain N902-109) TaxID=649831 RepID=UPI001E370D0A|nr:sigma factor-like helix-turn-helix DNA-binding protein [Actinoplanes sp. N902-109]
MPTRTATPTPAPPMELMLRSLPAPHRDVIIATYFGGRTTREAAELLGLAPATVTVRLYQAMHALSGMVATHRTDDAGLATAP